MKLTSLSDLLTVRMDAKVFTRLLYLARRFGWKPERLPEQWPTSSWHTEVILQETRSYREGLVSSVDSRGLSDALERVAANEAVSTNPELRFAIEQFIDILGRSAFLATEESTGDTVMFAR